MKTQELAKVTLQTEMDLIIAHKRCMKLAELSGLSLSAQTSFATAVSEVSRNTIEHGKNGCLVLSVSVSPSEKYILAQVKDEDRGSEHNLGLAYARRLVDRCDVVTSGNETTTELYYSVPNSFKVSPQTIDEWKQLFRNEPPISPYEEIKKKNDQLQELSQKLQESESQYKTLTDSLPIIIFSMNAKGELIYANEWLHRFTGFSIDQLNSSRWKNSVHPDDYDTFSLLVMGNGSHNTSIDKAQCRLRFKDSDDWYWHLVSVSPLNDEKGELLYWIGYVVDINAQKIIEETLKDNRELKVMQEKLESNQAALEENISDLNRSNLELQQFAYVASHDLQEPIRKVSYYSDYFMNKYADSFDGKAKEYLNAMVHASQRMRNLVHDLLSFSQVDKKGLELRRVDLNKIINDVLEDIEMLIREKKAVIEVEVLPTINADEGMMRQLFENLFTNSLKYSKEDTEPHISIGSRQTNDEIEIILTDNGIGFDQKYLPQMFTLFKRLHSGEKYKGTGMGLAICKKIVDLHGGSITALSRELEGATFIVSFPVKQL